MPNPLINSRDIGRQIEEVGLDFETKQISEYTVRDGDGRIILRTQSLRRLNFWWAARADEELAGAWDIDIYNN